MSQTPPVYQFAVALPDWAREAICYEIYPQTFRDANGDGVGDLPGIIEKLPYVAELGATAIWLNPFYLSPMRDAGYDVTDHRQVDPRYGTMDDARELFRRARELGLRVLLDFVPGHTSIDHPWFRESCRQLAPRPYRNWYIWTNSAWDNGGEDWAPQMIHGYGQRNGNFLTNFFWSQPALNFGFAEPELPWQLPTTHEDVQALWREMRSILRHWLELGASGFRVDMADSIIRLDPVCAETRRFWQETREELAADFPDLFLIAEGHPSNVLDGTGFHAAFIHWTAEYWPLFRPANLRSQSGTESEDDIVFDRAGRGDFRPFLNTWRQQHELTQGRGILAVPAGNHDLPRYACGQSDDDLEIVFAFLAAWPGIPFIYYGEEIGLRQQSSDNPIHEGHYPTRNGARTPMQWDSSANFGFSKAPATKLYLPVDPHPDATHAANSLTRPDGLARRIKALLACRQQQAAFAADAPMTIVSDGAPGQPIAFLRGEPGHRILCLLAPKEGEGELDCNEVLGNASLGEALLSGPQAVTAEGTRLHWNGPAWAYFPVLEKA